MEINLYDFDKTIYDGDSSVDFFFYALKHNKKIILRVPLMAFSALKYLLRINTKTKMKETIFSYVKDIKDIDSLIEEFWKSHKKNIKEFYIKKDHSKDIIISASPEFLLMPIKDYLKVLDLMASPVDKKSGKFNGLNCHDVEKVRRLNEKYKDYKVIESYSDSLADIPILELAENPYIVKGNKITKYK